MSDNPIPDPESPIPVKKKSPRIGCLVFFVLVMTGTFIAAGFLFVRWQTAVEGSNPNLNPVERLYLHNYLNSREAQLAAPAGDGAWQTEFIIESGESADIIAQRLWREGIVFDGDLFLNYLHFYGLDSQLEAGKFTLSPEMSIPQLAVALTDSEETYAITLNFLPGQRLEEMARYLAATTPGQIDADEFLAIAQGESDFDLTPYDFLVALPADATLEGYLFPDSYVIDGETTTADLVAMMLQNFGREVDPAMRQAFGAQGLSLREAVTLASIVGREGVMEEERPLIAAVFLNRLRDGIPLQADPTAQYALGYQPETDNWWKTGLTLQDLQFDSPYNTYVAPALPPGPIMSPDLASLQAVAYPEETTAYYFVADCDPERAGLHIFSQTYEEHLGHVERCRQ